MQFILTHLEEITRELSLVGLALGKTQKEVSDLHTQLDRLEENVAATMKHAKEKLNEGE